MPVKTYSHAFAERISHIKVIKCLPHAADMLQASERCVLSESVYLENDNSPRNREVDQETDCNAFPTHHPDIQQEPLSQSRTHVGQRQMVPSDYVVAGLVADDRLPCDLLAGGTLLVRAALCGCNGSFAAAWKLSVRPHAAAYDADDAKKHKRHYTLSQKTLLQTCKHKHGHH